ncbi:hypothetical protein CcCBS67573_g07588 [Chytriomyces confervae]|uniref:C2H2-type domain-containing protein n=1 Tax=Chytriomyces confervae TaxID=246404 RepID=A0A507ETF9_9FUNG|nr:hypothetical protein CcCBS67573_g07588 [Chytriomyces confervae]
MAPSAFFDTAPATPANQPHQQPAYRIAGINLLNSSNDFDSGFHHSMTTRLPSISHAFTPVPPVEMQTVLPFLGVVPSQQQRVVVAQGIIRATSTVSSSDDGTDSKTSQQHQQREVSPTLHLKQTRNRSGQTVYACPFPGCIKEFSESYNVKAHYFLHQNIRPYHCSSCTADFARLRDLQRHERSVHGSKKDFICSECGATDPLVLFMYPAIQMQCAYPANDHAAATPIFKGPGGVDLLCPETAKTLRIHPTYIPSTPYTPACFQPYLTYSPMTVRSSSACGPRHFPSMRPPSPAQSLPHLSPHALKPSSSPAQPSFNDYNSTSPHTTPQPVVVVDPQKQQRRHICPWDGCGKSFSEAYNLKSHYFLHSQVRPFSCSFCPSTFVRLRDMKRHESSLHSCGSRKEFSCVDCGMEFGRKDSLRRHGKTCAGHA